MGMILCLKLKCLIVPKSLKVDEKDALGGLRFDNDQDVEEFVRNWLVTQLQSFYEQGINKLPNRWEKCVEREGDYVEK